MQLVVALSGKNGEIIWRLAPNVLSSDIPMATVVGDLYTLNEIRDLDEDSIPDVLAAHVEEYRSSDQSNISGHVILISGQTGKLIRKVFTPNREEMYVPVQVHNQIDGTEMLLVATGGQKSPGGIYLIGLNTIMDRSKEDQFITVIRSESSGFMAPAVLSDLNDDGVDDIVVSSFNSTVYAFNGQTYAQLWNFTFADSESTSSIVPGHYNNDNITDFMVKYNCGPGFPVYYYSQTQIINGKNGTSLLDQMINDSGGAISLLGGISISQKFGGDLFLHWQTQCRGKYDVKDPYQFLYDSDILLQSRADTCRLRYNASTVLKLYAITRHMQSPGAVIFSTDDLLLQLNQTELKQLENQIAVSPLKHPKLAKKLQSTNEPSLNTNPVAIAVNNTKNNASIPAKNITGDVNVQKPITNTNKQTAFDKLKARKKLKDANRKNALPNGEQRVVTNNFEKPFYNEQPNEMDVQLPSEDEMNAENDLINQRKKQLKNYILNNINRAETRGQYANDMIQEQAQEQQLPAEVEDYQNYYDESGVDRQLMAMANNINRDVRSDENIPSKLLMMIKGLFFFVL